MQQDFEQQKRQEIGEDGLPGEGKLTDEVLEEKLREGKGPLPIVGGEPTDPPIPEPDREDSDRGIV